MKNKKVFVKKLVLNKKTIAELKNGDLSKIYGGVLTLDRTVCMTNCLMCTKVDC